VQEALRTALVEAIGPWCGHASRKRARAAAHAPGARAAPTLPALDARGWRGVGRDVLALHEGYTQRRGAFAHAANPIHTRLVAYQLYYLPRNWYRVHRVLDELPWDSRAGLPAPWLGGEGGRPTLRLLDLGCGTGAWSLAWLAWLAQRRAAPAPQGQPPAIELTLVDQGHTLLELAVANLEAFARRALPGVSLHCDVHADGVEAFLAQRPQGRAYAVAGAAMTLNELSLLGPRRVSERAAGLAAALQARLQPGGCLLFVEPGTRKGYMNLMSLRDQLLELPVLYPCPHNRPCPMWGGAVRHWCHATERLPADFFFDVALRQRAGLGFDMRDLQLAAFAAQAAPTGGPAGTPAAPFRLRAGERIVSAPMRARDPSTAPVPPQAVATGAGAAARIVLSCAPDGLLHERPAPPGGPYTRGRWSEGSGGPGSSGSASGPAPGDPRASRTAP
jgi:SAM-dependent methyltransferase